VLIMLISNLVKKAIINLSLDIKGGAQIQNKLYTYYPLLKQMLT
jgi:hypothetical protein